MNKFEVIKVENIDTLKSPTIYFYLKKCGFSENFIKKLRKTENSILKNENPANLRSKITPNDTIKILSEPHSASDIPPCEGKLDILFEDEDFLIVNKPHNLACIPTRSHISDNLGGRIANYMKNKSQNFVLRIVNRLDKETAGIVIVAKSVIAYKNLSNLQKTYFAICKGNFDKSFFTIDKPILTKTNNGINEIKRVVDERGKKAITQIEVQRCMQGLSLVKLHLQTGRTHQIRVHLSSENHPLLGDTLYGTPTKENHVFLILKEVKFDHFRLNKTLSFSIDFPDDWKNYLCGI